MEIITKSSVSNMKACELKFQDDIGDEWLIQIPDGGSPMETKIFKNGTQTGLIVGFSFSISVDDPFPEFATCQIKMK